MVSHGDHEVIIECGLQKPGFLFLGDAQYPGWTARVNGRQAEILRADYLFQAVALQEGSHRVVFTYEPWWKPWAWCLSVLGLLLALALARPVCRLAGAARG